MPTVLRIGQFRFHFYSDEWNEPAHIHVATPDGECKYWLAPVLCAKIRNVRPHIVREIEKLVYQNQEYLLEKYYEFHSNQ
jgi:hypothetical protein